MCRGNGWHDHEAGATHTIQSWITSWTEFLSTTAPMIFLVAVIVYGSWRIIMRGGGWPWKTMVFVLGAALVYLLLTNVEEVAESFRRELPLGLTG